MLFKALALAAALAGVMAQRPDNISICDYYTTALLKNNTAVNQKTLLTLVVNTAVIGNYTKPNVGITVPGILAPGTFNGTAVNLLPYFSGGFASTNQGGSSGVSVNFLDDGGAAPLLLNMPANGTSSNQYLLLTHLYEYFGALVGCSLLGTGDYKAYDGRASMYQVHKFMDLSYADVGYFIQQVALSAASFGVAQSDLMIVGQALGSVFNVACGPPTTIVPSQGPQLESICLGDNCPLAPNANCSAYQNVSRPAVASSSSATATGTTPSGTASLAGSAAGSATGTSTAKPSSAAAPMAVPAGVVALGAMVAYLL